MIRYAQAGKSKEQATAGTYFSSVRPVNLVDPSFHASSFGADGADGPKPVADHATHTDTGTGHLDPQTEALHNAAAAATGQPGKMLGP